jgi:hypothetical protein
MHLRGRAVPPDPIPEPDDWSGEDIDDPTFDEASSDE